MLDGGPSILVSEASGGQMFVKPILASMSIETGLRITTMHVRVPRIIWPEIMTHRVFSRNARSSRAVPVKGMIDEIRNAPFIPWHWTKNQPGMQGEGDYDAPITSGPMCPFDMIESRFDPVSREKTWLWARDRALEAAEAFNSAGYHKQVVNRLLEPFMYIDGLITSVSWANFDWLRRHEAAEPHFMELASMVHEVMSSLDRQLLKHGEWHLPYINEEDHLLTEEMFPDPDEDFLNGDRITLLRKISAARSARISYVPFNGQGTIEAELARYDLLVSSDRVHASPLEHQATPDTMSADESWSRPDLHGNLTGFIQARKLVPNEFIPDQA